MRPSGKIWIKSVTGVLRIRNWLLRCVGTTVDIVVKIREREFAGCAIIMRSSSVVAGWAKTHYENTPMQYTDFLLGCKNKKKSLEKF